MKLRRRTSKYIKKKYKIYLYMKIGYDFDGVLHKNVTEVDGLGEKNYNGDNNLLGLYGIFNKIKNDIHNNNELYIISRGERDTVISNLKKLAINIFFKDENIITDLGKLNISKSDIIKDKKIDVFFDDSVFNIHEINREKKKNNIKTHLYLVDPITETYKRIRSNNIKILTYNVNWQNMIGHKKAPISNCKEKNLCARNINKLIINELPLDFIFIQEFENEKILLDKLNKDFILVTSNSDKETIGILINKKYNFDYAIKGEFEQGRPFLIVFLKENICLISVHMGHNKNVLTELKKIEYAIYNNKIHIDNYRIIMGGDFNADLTMENLFCEKKLLNFKKKFTCCIYSKHMGKNKDILKYMNGKNIDHILDSKAEPVYGTVVTPIDNNILKPGSDHLGIYAELEA
jgi:hypothetical protein